MFTFFFGITGLSCIIFRKDLAGVIFNAQLPFYEFMLGNRLNKTKILKYYSWALIFAGVVLICMALSNHFGPLQL